MKLLFIRFSSLGDIILTTGVLKKFSETFPEAEINILTYDEFAPVLRALPFVANIYSIPRKMTLSAFSAYLRILPSFTHVIDWHNNLRSRAAGFILKGKVSRYNKQSICRRLYVKYRFCGGRLAPHTIIRYAEALFPLFNLDVPTLESMRPWLPNEAVTAPKKVVVHPFASKYTKIWPYFPELVKQLKQDGWDIFIAGKGDFPEEIGVNRIETPTLTNLFNLMRDAALVVSTDSGPMHAATALNRNLIALFGSTSKELGFYPCFSGCTVIENEGLPCRPCHVHGLPECPLKHFKCMKDISVERVLRSAKNPI